MADSAPLSRADEIIYQGASVLESTTVQPTLCSTLAILRRCEKRAYRKPLRCMKCHRVRFNELRNTARKRPVPIPDSIEARIDRRDFGCVVRKCTVIPSDFEVLREMLGFDLLFCCRFPDVVELAHVARVGEVAQVVQFGLRVVPADLILEPSGL